MDYDNLKIQFAAKNGNIYLERINELEARGVNSIHEAAEYAAYWNDASSIVYGLLKGVGVSTSINTDDEFRQLDMHIYNITGKRSTLFGNGSMYPTYFMAKFRGNSDNTFAITLYEAYADTRTLTRNVDGTWSRRTNGSVGKILSYSTDPLTMLTFKSLSYEKAGDFENQLTYYGVELEVNVRKDGSLESTAVAVHTDLTPEFVILKQDGSIGYGFEIVSAPATLAYHHTAWDSFFNNSAKLCSSWTNNQCGMHVHISRAGFLSPVHMAKMMAFYNAPYNKSFIERIAGRQDERWCKIRENANALMYRLLKGNKGTTYTGDPLNASLHHSKSGDKHMAVNLMKKNTVEIRIFKGNTSKVGFFKNLEFVDAVFEYSKILRFNPLTDKEKELYAKRLKHGSKGQEMDIYGLAYNDFLKWVVKDKAGRYPNLQLWLFKNKLINNYKEKQVTSSTPANKVITEADVLAVA